MIIPRAIVPHMARADDERLSKRREITASAQSRRREAPALERRGQPGAPGERGADGVDGEDGLDGAAGAKGDKGDPGDPGADGADGAKGDKGDPGDTGAQGIPGANGLNGAAGADGAQGERGLQGPPGEDGIDGVDGAPGQRGDKGDQGERGLQGPPGDDGTNGEDGRPGVQGSQGDRGPAGVPGDIYAPEDVPEMIYRPPYPSGRSHIYEWSQGANQAINTFCNANCGNYGTGLAAETLASHVTLAPGTLSLFSAAVPDLVGSSNTVTFSLRVNGVSVGTVTVTAGQTGNTNLTLGVKVDARSRITVQQTTANSVGVAFHLSVLWQGF